MSTCKGHSNIIWLNLGVLLLHWKSCCPSLVYAWMPASLTTFSHMSAVFANKLIVILVRQTPPQLVVWVWISNLISAKKKDTLHAQNYVFPQWTGSCSNLTPHRCSVCCLDNWGPPCVCVSLCLCACVYVLLSTHLLQLALLTVWPLST